MMRRQQTLGAALAVTLGATLWAALQDGAEGVPISPPGGRAAVADIPAGATARPGRAGSPTPVAAAPVRLPALPETSDRVPLAAEGAGFAAPLSFRPPPPPPPPPARLQALAPPLPFRYVGAIFEDGARRALLMEGEQLRILRSGEEIGGRYRVDHIDDSRIDFIYLPLKQRQSLSVSRS
ncbi:MAG: hypothetical protein KIS72_08300 [Luteimonas sp.]|nr:hypothetical protein [Luteimonas sp.]